MTKRAAAAVSEDAPGTFRHLAGAPDVDLDRPLRRYARNPILTCHRVNAAWRDPGLAVNTVHNAGIATFGGEVLMLFRAHLRCGVSVLGVARSADGLTGWRVDPRPAMVPCDRRDSFAAGTDPESLIENEAGGVEDPRITGIDGTFYITYSAYHARIKDRVRVSLATTTDFRTFTRHGPLLERDTRNVVIFPARIGGRYHGLFRPNDEADGAGPTGGRYTEIRLGTTAALESNRWELQAQPLLRTGGGPSAFADKIGPGAPPLPTPHGWISIFHGVRTTMDGHPYVLGVALHDRARPGHVQVSAIPILFPSPADCAVPSTDYVHVPNVVFTCGALRREDGTIVVYYGGNDTVMNVAVTHEDVLAELCRRYPLDLATGRPAYGLR